MRLSDYFENLSKAYQAEIEDLQSDSEGNNVLAARLKQKRTQFALLMPMIDCAPEMVAVAFHGGITFVDPHVLLMLSFAEPDEFLPWEELRQAVYFEPWAEKLIPVALAEPGGKDFLITVICLEYLHEKGNARSTIDHDGESRSAEHDDDRDEGERHLDGDDDDDLAEAGADWMSEQGFDRRE